MKKSGKAILCLLLICGIAIACIGCSSLLKSPGSYVGVIRTNWGIELPSAGAHEVFGYSEPSFHGDGIRYHVIEYPVGEETKKAQDSVSLLEEIFRNSSYPTEKQIADVEHFIKDIEVKEDWIPCWIECKLIYQRHQDSSELFLFYQSETGTVYVVESFL